MTEALHLAYLVLFGLLVLLVADAPFKAFGQGYVANRRRERLILFGVEVGLVALWAITVFLLRQARRLVSRGSACRPATRPAWCRLRRSNEPAPPCFARAG